MLPRLKHIFTLEEDGLEIIQPPLSLTQKDKRILNAKKKKSDSDEDDDDDDDDDNDEDTQITNAYYYILDRLHVIPYSTLDLRKVVRNIIKSSKSTGYNDNSTITPFSALDALITQITTILPSFDLYIGGAEGNQCGVKFMNAYMFFKNATWGGMKCCQCIDVPEYTGLRFKTVSYNEEIYGKYVSTRNLIHCLINHDASKDASKELKKSIGDVKGRELTGKVYQMLLKHNIITLHDCTNDTPIDDIFVISTGVNGLTYFERLIPSQTKKRFKIFLLKHPLSATDFAQIDKLYPILDQIRHLIRSFHSKVMNVNLQVVHVPIIPPLTIQQIEYITHSSHPLLSRPISLSNTTTNTTSTKETIPVSLLVNKEETSNQSIVVPLDKTKGKERSKKRVRFGDYNSVDIPPQDKEECSTPHDNEYIFDVKDYNLACREESYLPNLLVVEEKLFQTSIGEEEQEKPEQQDDYKSASPPSCSDIEEEFIVPSDDCMDECTASLNEKEVDNDNSTNDKVSDSPQSECYIFGDCSNELSFDWEEVSRKLRQFLNDHNDECEDKSPLVMLQFPQKKMDELGNNNKEVDGVTPSLSSSLASPFKTTIKLIVKSTSCNDSTHVTPPVDENLLVKETKKRRRSRKSIKKEKDDEFMPDPSLMRRYPERDRKQTNKF